MRNPVLLAAWFTLVLLVLLMLANGCVDGGVAVFSTFAIVALALSGDMLRRFQLARQPAK